MTLDELLLIAGRAYFATLHDYRAPENWSGARLLTGEYDMLAKFVRLELTETFSGGDTYSDQLNAAVRVMTRAQDDLQAVVRALLDELSRRDEEALRAATEGRTT